MIKAATNSVLRRAIVKEMQAAKKRWVELGLLETSDPFKYPTWWFKHSIAYSTKEVRKELILMEREGLLISDRSQSNNTLWVLVGDANGTT